MAFVVVGVFVAIECHGEFRIVSEPSGFVADSGSQEKHDIFARGFSVGEIRIAEVVERLEFAD